MKTNLLQFTWRVTALHTVTYFVAGLFFSQLFNYSSLFDTEILSVYMKPVSSPWVAAGPALNILRGILFGLILWGLKDAFLNVKYGWLKLWSVFLGFAVVGTAAAAQGSLEGIIYSELPLMTHLKGLPEVLTQTLLFSVLLLQWYRKPGKIWNIVMGILLGLIVLMSMAGVFLR